MLKYLWQLPQHLLALIILRIYKHKVARVENYKTAKVYWLRSINWGMSLGDYIFLSTLHHDNVTVAHEYGHTLQSYMLGWLYLIIIGIPSGGQNLLTQASILSHTNYYYRWPETWADKLGGVVRIGTRGFLVKKDGE